LITKHLSIRRYFGQSNGVNPRDTQRTSMPITTCTVMLCNCLATISLLLLALGMTLLEPITLLMAQNSGAL
jgi:hypothetical protein